MSCGIVLIDMSGHVLSVNDKADRMLRNGLYLAHGRIEASDADGAVALRNGIALTFDTKKRNKRQHTFLIPRGGAKPPYVMHTYLMAASSSAAKPPTTAILLIIDPDHEQRIPAEFLADLLSLPAGEARVAAEIASGVTPRVAAKNLGLTEDSVRVILKRVYSKVNVSRQAELVLLASRFGNCTPDT